MNGQNSAPDGSTQRDSNPQKTGALVVGSKSDLATSRSAENKMIRAEEFDQPIILQQPNTWSRAIAMGIVGVTVLTIGWASVAKMDEAVMATGQLEPQGAVQPIQAPINGAVVEEIYVKDGQRVKQGDLLIRFDPTAGAAELRAAEQIRDSLVRQNQFYRSQLAGSSPVSVAEISKLNLPPEVLSLTKNRETLLEENRLYQAQLAGNTASLTPEQQIRAQTGLLESQSRAAAAQAKVAQAQQQLSQTQAQLQSARKSLAIDEKIYNDLAPLLVDGGIARVQVVRQEQQVIESRAEVNRLEQEEQRLQYAISQAQQELANTVAVSGKDLLDKIAENNEQIAAIDSQLNKVILDNESQIAESEKRLSQAQLTLRYQELRAPVDGIVFDLQAKGRGFVANSSEPILKIVPGNALVAEVYITNKDIGFVSEGMPVDVRVDSFPFSEFGDIKGTLVNVGSDALPLTRFTITIGSQPRLKLTDRLSASGK
ncbi:MAG: HlyD family efflux transporter periplasmic adaptor subunit [Leptolyngbya sp. IPPAS B-1204]